MTGSSSIIASSPLSFRNLDIKRNCKCMNSIFMFHQTNLHICKFSIEKCSYQKLSWNLYHAGIHNEDFVDFYACRILGYGVFENLFVFLIPFGSIYHDSSKTFIPRQNCPCGNIV